MECKYMEDTTDLFVRLDFPGVTKESVKILLVPAMKALLVVGDAPKEHRHDSSHRKYGSASGLVCDCCQISNIQCFVGDGVVRLILSKQRINLHVPFSCSFGEARMRLQPHPFLIFVDIAHKIRRPRVGSEYRNSQCWGPRSAYESKRLSNGGLFLRIDMPGVPTDHFTVMLESDSGVTVIGRAPPAMYDSSGREYRGKVAVVPPDYDNRRIKVIAKHGVIRLIIPRPF